MKLSQLEPLHFVSDQLLPADFVILAAQGIRSVVNNRPDAEAAGQPRSTELEEAAKLVGIEYVHAPIATQFMTLAELESNRQLLAALPPPICGFCRTGARAAISWGLLRIGELRKSTVIDAVAGAGLPTDGLTKQICPTAGRDKEN